MDAVLTLGLINLRTDSLEALPTFATIYEGVSRVVAEHGQARVIIERTVDGEPRHDRLILEPRDVRLSVDGQVARELLAPIDAKVQELRDLHSEVGYLPIPDLQAHFDSTL